MIEFMTLTVSNIERSLKFYDTALGLWASTTSSPTEVSMAILISGDLVMERELTFGLS
jgi:predicted enzyme related to lactoylglutathione lyase